MLQHLHIENIAVIETADIQFQPGFNVLTGETGAGKSIVIDSLLAILGGRTSRDLVRHGQTKAVVSALFTGLPQQAQDLAAELGFESEEGTLLVSREILQDGRNLCRVGGRPASVSILKTLGALLVNIHGQNDGAQLLDERSHIDYLDAFGGYEDQLAEYYAQYQSLLSLRRQIKQKIERGEQLRQRADFLQYQLAELESADLKPGEYEALNERRMLLANVEKIATGVMEAKLALYGDEDQPGVTELLTGVEARLRSCESWSEEIRGFCGRAGELLALSQELERDIDAFSNSIDYTPAELAATEERLDTIGRLMKKYGRDEAELLALQEETRQQLDDLETMDDDLAACNQAYAAKRDQVQALSQALHQRRMCAAKNLSARIEEELHQLDMPHARFCVQVQSTAEQGHVKFTRRGTDNVVFLLTTNPGESLKPLHKVASGGELSRIMLAIKSVLSGADAVGTLIFDEIDTGVSGRAANKVGEKLFALSLEKQVLCVTHLPQIAALGQHQFRIQKQVEGGRTLTKVEPLDRQGRIQEIARMTAGMDITQQTLRNAQEILAIAEAFQQATVDKRGKGCYSKHQEMR